MPGTIRDLAICGHFEKKNRGRYSEREVATEYVERRLVIRLAAEEHSRV